jgi:hypothetical protein
MSKDEKGNARLSRRELIEKYGAYTAPVVVAMLTPSEVYAHKNGEVYSTVAACTSDTANSVMGAVHGPGRPHCMDGSPGGSNAHPIINL